MGYYFYFLLFALFQIFLFIFLLEKRRKQNIKSFKLISFWIMLAGFIFLLGVGIYIPIKKQSIILEYRAPTNFEEFDMKEVLEPIKEKLDVDKDIYFLDYNINLSNENGYDVYLHINLFGSYMGKYYRFEFDAEDGKCKLSRYNQIYENVYKDMNFLTLNEVLVMNDIINYEAIFEQYSSIIDSKCESINSNINVLFVYWPERLGLNKSYQKVNVLSPNGSFVYYDESEIISGDVVLVQFDFTVLGMDSSYYLMVR